MKIILISIPFLLFLVIVLAIIRSAGKKYTHQEWEEQCKKDFEKYGPVPEDKD